MVETYYHLEKHKYQNLKLRKEVSRNIYVDNCIRGGKPKQRFGKAKPEPFQCSNFVNFP